MENQEEKGVKTGGNNHICRKKACILTGVAHNLNLIVPKVLRRYAYRSNGRDYYSGRQVQNRGELEISVPRRDAEGLSAGLRSSRYKSAIQPRF